MLPADLALQVLPGEFSALDAVPPAVVAGVLIGYLLLRWRRQQDDSREQADASTWQRMQQANEVLVQQRDDAFAQVARRDELIRQQADHISDLEQRNSDLRRDLREALRRIDHQQEETP